MFLKQGSSLVSNGTVVENGMIKISTTFWASLTSDNVLNDLRERDERQIAQRHEQSTALM